MDWNVVQDHNKPKFWLIIGVIALGLIVLGYGVFNMIGALIWYAIGFTIFGVGVYLLDFHTIQELGRRWVRFFTAIGLALVWAMISANTFSAWWAQVILVPWSVLVLLSSFALGATLWKNRDAVAQRIDDVRQGKADYRDVAREAWGGIKTAAETGLNDAKGELKRGSGRT